jgi:TolB-like protein/Tfp pilus assembly protein PilF
MAALYAVAAWLIMQVAEVVMTLAVLPDWTGRLTLILLAIGFPIALAFSWFYELTAEGLSLEKEVEPGASITHKTGRRLDFVVISLLCAALIVFAYDKWWISGSPVTSIVVLPFEDFGAGVAQEYLADSMTEVLTAELGQIKSLRVISRTSAMHYQDTEKRLPEIAAELGVDAVIEGSIQPAGDEVRFTLQMIDGRTDRHLWARSYHRELGDILTLQGEIARAIADEVQVVLTPQTEAHFARERPTDSEALRFWVIGNHHLKGADPDSFQKALRAFNEAIKRDPEFPDAYAGIAQTYVSLGGWHGSEQVESILPLAKSATDKALSLNPDLSAAHFSLAMIHRHNRAWEAAERAYRRGAELNPSDSIGLLEYSNYLTQIGRADQAIQVAMRVVEIDPLEPASYNELGFAILWGGGEIDAALTQYNKSLQLSPGFWQTHLSLADLFLSNGQIQKAMPHLDEMEKTVESQSPTMFGLLGLQYGLAGRDDEAREILSQLREKAESEYVPATAVAYLYLGLGDYDEALKWLDAAYEERDPSLVWLNKYWVYDVLRDDVRFQDLVSRMNFPDQ